MKVLLLGASGYIGRRLIPVLIEAGHEVVAGVRNPRSIDGVKTIGVDLKNPASLDRLPKDIDAAYYLVHSMAAGKAHFEKLDELCARNFVVYINKTSARQVIFLGGLYGEEPLSSHMASRRHVEQILGTSSVPLTALHAAIIIGSGSASFEIIRDLVEKLPIMVAPRWIKSRCQPISIVDVVAYLKGLLGLEVAFGRSFDIGGPDILSYREIMLRFARFRKLHRHIIDVPVLTPNLSSLWLVFITGVNFSIARSLVDSLKSDAVCKERTIDEILPRTCLTFEQAIQRAFHKIAEHGVISSWRDAWMTGEVERSLSKYLQAPQAGCLIDQRTVWSPLSRDDLIERIWRIGGENGWYFMNWAWTLRGKIDRLFGGVGAYRGRRDPIDLRDGDILDFWRVLLADKEGGRLLLYAEMKVPGEAWLELRVDGGHLYQRATLRPRGIWGRLYWYGVYPIHVLIFRGMARRIAGP